MLCPRCGEEKEDFVGKICVDCFLDDEDLVEFEESPSITVCVSCGSVKIGNWRDVNVEEGVRLAVREATDVDERLEHPVVSFDVEEALPDRVTGVLSVEGGLGGRHIVVNEEVDVDVGRGICRRCSRASRGYYEAVLQVRSSTGEVSEEDVERVAEEARSLAEGATGDKPFLSKAEEVKGGVDVYLGDSQMAKRLAHRLKDEMGAETTQSASLVGRQDGREVHRPTYLVRLPRFREGDVLRFRGRRYAVRSTGKRVDLVDVESGVHDYVPAGELDEAGERVGNLDDVEETVLVMVDGDEVQVLDPDTLRAVTMSRPQFIEEEDQGDKVPVLDLEGGFVLVHPEVGR